MARQIDSFIPDPGSPVVDPRTGIVTQAWYRFFSNFLSPPGPIVSVPITASPMMYKVPRNGGIIVSGGIVSSISLTRANVNVTLGITSGLIQIAPGDTVVISYTSAPSVFFVPG